MHETKSSAAFDYAVGIETDKTILSFNLHPLEVSVSALKHLAGHDIAIANELLESQIENSPKAITTPDNVVLLDNYRKTKLIPVEKPSAHLGYRNEGELLEWPQEQVALEPEEAEETEPGAEPKIDIADEILNLPEVMDVVDKGFSSLEEIAQLAKEFGVDAESLLEFMRQMDVDIEVFTGQEPEVSKKALKKELAEASRNTTEAFQLFLNDAGRYELLTPAEEVVLAKRVERGDLEAKKQMMNSNLRLVVSIAKRYQGHGVPLLDLVQDSVVGLNRAVEKFDWRLGFKFSTYATWWIRQSCQRAVANQGKNIRIPVHVVERQQKLARASSKFAASEGREATAEELAEITRIRLDHVEEALATPSVTSLNQRIGEDGDGELGDLFADENAVDPVEEADRTLRQDQVRGALKELPHPQGRILEMRFGFEGEPLPLESIGRELGLTREKVRFFEGLGLKAMKTKLESKLVPQAQ